MTKVISFPRPRFVSNQEKALELTAILRPLIVNHLKHVQMLQVGDANPNLRSEVEQMFQGSVTYYGRYAYEHKASGERRVASQPFLRFMYSVNPYDQAFGDWDDLLDDTSTDMVIAPDVARCYYNPAQFKQIIRNVMFANTEELLKARKGKAPIASEIYAGHYQVWMWLKDLHVIAFYTDVVTRRDGTTWVTPYPDQALINDLPTPSTWFQDFDPEKRGTRRISDRVLKPSEQAEEAVKSTPDSGPRVFNSATGTHDLVQESSHDAMDNAEFLEDISRRASREHNDTRRQLASLIG